MIEGGKRLFIFFLVVLGLGLSGCGPLSKLMNPYDDKFECPQFEKGKCVSIKDAYLESLQSGGANVLFTPTPSTSQAEKQEKKGNQEKGNQERKGGQEGASFSVQSVFPQDSNFEMFSKYNEALLKKLQQMLESPKTPVLIPPQVIRVLILPYAADKSTFYAERYAYVIVEDPQWVFHNILNGEELK
jgi:conjugal transfer pilus assembly protein TraV